VSTYLEWKFINRLAHDRADLLMSQSAHERTCVSAGPMKDNLIPSGNGLAVERVQVYVILHADGF
jgi:hypothetical protein